MLVEIQPLVNEKGNVVVHGHVNGVLQSVHHQIIRIRVVRPIDCIIKLQQLFFVAEDHFKHPGFIGTVRYGSLSPPQWPTFYLRLSGLLVPFFIKYLLTGNGQEASFIHPLATRTIGKPRCFVDN